MTDSLCIFILLMLILWSGYVPLQIEGNPGITYPIKVLTATKHPINDALALEIPRKLTELVGKFTTAGSKKGVNGGGQEVYEEVTWMWVISVRRFGTRRKYEMEIESLVAAIDEQCNKEVVPVTGKKEVWEGQRRYGQTSIFGYTDALQILVYVCAWNLFHEMQLSSGEGIVVTAFEYVVTKMYMEHELGQYRPYMLQEMMKAKAEMIEHVKLKVVPLAGKQVMEPQVLLTYGGAQFHIIMGMQLKSEIGMQEQDLLHLIDKAWLKVLGEASSTLGPPHPSHAQLHTHILVLLPQMDMLVIILPFNNPTPPQDFMLSANFQEPPHSLLNLAKPFASLFQSTQHGHLKFLQFPQQLQDYFIDMELQFFDNKQSAILNNAVLAPSSSTSSSSLIIHPKTLPQSANPNHDK